MSGETVYRLWNAVEPAGDAVQSTSDASNACGVPGGEQTVHLTERVGIWLLTARAGVNANGESAQVAALKRELLHCNDISNAVGGLTSDISEARRLAARYMTALWTQENDISWWQTNSEYLAQPWFIQEYAQARGWLPAPQPGVMTPYYVLMPESGAASECVHMRIERHTGAPAQGEVYIEAAPEVLPGALMRTLHCAQVDPGRYVRRVREVHGCIIDRAVEVGMALLEAGYRLSVQERALRDGILEGSYEPMHRYWIYESSQPELLYIGYPWEAKLHNYVRRAGGYWNGRRMEILVCQVDALEELALRYGFRFTSEARRRLDTWREASMQATIYRNRKRKPSMEEIQDEFVKLLNRPIQVPEDLQDEK